VDLHKILQQAHPAEQAVGEQVDLERPELMHWAAEAAAEDLILEPREAQAVQALLLLEHPLILLEQLHQEQTRLQLHLVQTEQQKFVLLR
jgi:hypothetical protein